MSKKSELNNGEKTKLNTSRTRHITAADALTISIPERIQIVEEIGDTIASKTEAIELTEEEKKIIDERIEAYYREPDLGSSREEVYNKIVKKNIVI